MIYVQINDILMKYDGMSEETVAKMLTEQSLDYIFIDQSTYLQKLADLESLHP